MSAWPAHLKSLLGCIVERQGDAARDPGGFGTITGYEAASKLSPPQEWVWVRTSGKWTVDGAPKLVLTRQDLERDWVLLTMQPVPEVAPTSCVKCGRVFFYPGACPSRTCQPHLERV